MSKRDWIYVVVFTIVWVIAVSLFAADARGINISRPIPADQFNAKTHIWLARAMVAEGGWTAGNDHIATAFVYSRRWRAMRKRWPDLRFIDVLFRYSKGLGANRREYSARQVWIRSLSPTMVQPDGWPREASWKRHAPLWAQTLDRAQLWAQGRLLDPCRGLATHFGGDMDKPADNMVEVSCNGTANTFYKIERGKHGR